jgi:hypothetical protein
MTSGAAVGGGAYFLGDSMPRFSLCVRVSERGFCTTQTVSFGEPVVKSKSALRSVVYGAYTDGS